MDQRTLGILLIALVAFGVTHVFADDNQALVAVATQAAQAKVFNVRSYGAVGDGVAMDTAAVQKTIDACHAEGGGIVRVPSGDFQIGTIWLRSNITLSLDHGASLLGSLDIAEYTTKGLSRPREGGPHCLIYAEDARNIVVRNCKVSSNTAPLKFGTSSRGGFIDVSVTNCYFYNSPMGAIKLQLVDGGRLENVDISRIVMEDVGNPIFIRLGNRGRSYGKRERPFVGTLKNIRIRDVVAKVTIEDRAEAARAGYKNLTVETSPEVTDAEKSKSGPIMITGIPGHCVENVVLEDVTISYPGGGTEKDAQRAVPEDIARYPEQFFFGVLPAWGAHIRHARNVEFRNVVLKTRSPDARKKIVLDDVEGFSESSLDRQQKTAN